MKKGRERNGIRPTQAIISSMRKMLYTLMIKDRILAYILNKLINSFEQIKKSIATYIRVKFIMSVFTGIGTYIVCLLFHIDFALFWGFLAFVLNFLPTVGSIAGVVPPALMGIIQLDTLGMVGFLIFVLFLVQTLFGNILEPIFMGKGVALNTIVVILGLVLWGYLWGFYGMLLSVPLMVTVKVILSNVEGAGFLVRLLGTEKAKKIAK